MAERAVIVGRRAAVFLLALHGLAAPLAAQQFDLLIRGARVLDGTGNPWYFADIGVTGDRIAALGDLSAARATRTIDAAGFYVAPGFIDAHSHSGPAPSTHRAASLRRTS